MEYETRPGWTYMYRCNGCGVKEAVLTAVLWQLVFSFVRVAVQHWRCSREARP